MSKTVLIVDDHPSFRASARRLLEAAGYEVIGEAADGKGAIAALKDLRPDVVLLDVQLPDVSGIDLSARVTGQDNAPSVVLVSSREASDYGSALTCCGARGFLSKGDLSGNALAELIG